MTVVHSLLLGVHLLLVGGASAAPILAAWLEWKDAKGDPLAGPAGRRLAAMSFWFLWLGALLGLALGWLDWRPEFRESLLRLGSRLHSAGAEWLFSVTLIGVHYLWWRLSPKPRRAWRFVRALLPILAATNLLYHFPMFFQVLRQLVNETSARDVGEAAAGPITGAEFRQRMANAAVIARASHFWLASIVAAGLMLLWPARSKATASDSHDQPLLPANPPTDADVAKEAEAKTNESTTDSDDGRRAIRWGARWALFAAVLQLPVGMWLLVELPTNSQRALMGGDMTASALFVIGVFAALGLMHFLASLGMGRASRQDLRAQRGQAAVAIGLGVAVVLLMSAAAQLSRPSLPSAVPRAGESPSPEPRS